MPRVTVVIPAYNRAHLICETVDSVLSQTFGDFEIIVVDDGSMDGTADMLQRYSTERVRVISQENRGQGGARNAGIRAALGEFVAFLDSDDLWLSNKLEQQVSLFDTHPDLGWVYSDTDVFDDANGRSLYLFGRRFGRPWEGMVGRRLILQCFVASPTPIARLTALKDVGFFDESPLLHNRADWDMWLRLAARYAVGYVPKPLARYRVHAGNDSRGEDPWFVHRSHIAAIERAVSFAPDVYGPVRRRAISAQYVRTGYNFAVLGRSQEARTALTTGIRWWPGNPRAYLLLLAGSFGYGRVSSWVRHIRSLRQNSADLVGRLYR